MRQTTIDELKELTVFAETVAREFLLHPDYNSYGDVEKAGGYIALRWGLCDDRALILKMDPDFSPINIPVSER